MTTRAIALPDPELDEDEPIDLVALQADDELIGALASGWTVAAGEGRASDDRVSAMLAAWKAELDAEPFPALVDLDTAVATVQAARRPAGRTRHLVPVAAAAAALVALLGGVSLGSYSAEPDDVLWPVTKVLYSERAESVEAAGRVEGHIARAKQAIAAGQPAVAERELAAAAAELAVVRPEEGRTELVDVQSFLTAKAAETVPGVPTDPGSPLIADRTRKVPPGAGLNSSSAASTSATSSGAGSSGPPAPASGPAAGPVAPAPPPAPALVPAPAPAEAPAPAPGPGPAPAPADPQIVRQAPPPADQPAPSDPLPADPPPAQPPQGETGAPTSAAPDPAPPANSDAPAEGQSIGATPADTGSTAASPTS